MISRDILEELYQSKGMSVAKVAHHLGTTEHTIRWWMKKHNIPFRTHAEASYAQHNKQFLIKARLTPQERILYGLGLGLYWGEGNKASEYSVRVGNTDPQLILIFKQFIEVICGVQEKDIQYGLQLFNDSNPEASLEYWCKVLNCKPSSFHPTVIISAVRGKGTYKNKSEHGVLQLYVNNKRLKIWLMNELDKVRYTFAEVAQW